MCSCFCVPLNDFLCFCWDCNNFFKVSCHPSIFHEQLTIFRSNATKVLVFLYFYRAVWSSCILCTCGLYLFIFCWPCAVYLPGFTWFSFCSLYYTFLFSPIVSSVSSFSFLPSQAMDLYISVVGQTTPNVTITTVQWEVRSSVTYVFISPQSLFQWMNFIIQHRGLSIVITVVILFMDVYQQSILQQCKSFFYFLVLESIIFHKYMLKMYFDAICLLYPYCCIFVVITYNYLFR